MVKVCLKLGNKVFKIMYCYGFLPNFFCYLFRLLNLIKSG